MSEKISIVIPTSRRPDLLRAALFSVANQVVRPAEVVIVCDSCDPISMDGIRSDFQARRLVCDRPFGASAARNMGACAATGEWLAFLDDDDWWLPEYLSALRQATERSRLDVVCTSFLAADHRGIFPEKAAPADLSKADFFSSNPGFRGSNLFIRRSVFLELGGFAENLPAFNDMDLGLRLSASPGLRYLGIAERMVVFRNHTGPRLTSRHSRYVRAALPQFLARHGPTMTPSQRRAFAMRLKRLWSIDCH